MKVSQTWLKDCKSTEDKEKRKEQLRVSAYTLGVLKRILEDKLEENYRTQRQYDYADQAWPYKQADHIGSQRVYKEIIDLITLEKEDK